MAYNVKISLKDSCHVGYSILHVMNLNIRSTVPTTKEENVIPKIAKKCSIVRFIQIQNK